MIAILQCGKLSRVCLPPETFGGGIPFIRLHLVETPDMRGMPDV